LQVTVATFTEQAVQQPTEIQKFKAQKRAAPLRMALTIISRLDVTGTIVAANITK
jgi:hypothetical protein